MIRRMPPRDLEAACSCPGRWVAVARHRQVVADLWIERARRLAGAREWFTIQSGSMLPSLRPGEKVEGQLGTDLRPSPGSLVLYVGDAGLPVVHRLVGYTGSLTGTSPLECGDAGWSIAMLAPERTIATVRRLQMGRTEVDLSLPHAVRANAWAAAAVRGFVALANRAPWTRRFTGAPRRLVLQVCRLFLIRFARARDPVSLSRVQ